MDRRRELLRTVDKGQRGIEIAPWFAPLTPKREGYNCLTLDILPRDELVARGQKDPNIERRRLDDIEEVDIVGSAVEIGRLVAEKGLLGSFDYVISSHNFEHLANPIKFLQGCGDVLRPGGLLIMALPDCRGCFDHFRNPTMLAEWLQAYHDDSSRPTRAQIFNQAAYHSRQRKNGRETTAFSIHDDPALIEPYQTLREAYDDWRRTLGSGDKGYRDTHCSAFTPASFQLLIEECRYLELTGLRPLDVTETNRFEFYAHLENCGRQRADAEASAAFYRRRAELLAAIRDELAQTSRWGWRREHASYAGRLKRAMHRLPRVLRTFWP